MATAEKLNFERVGQVKKYIIIIVSVIILSMIGYGVYSYYQIANPKVLFENPPKRVDTPNADIKEEDKPASVEVDPLLEDPFEFSERVNFLFLGLDASVERYETMDSFRTDTIMLISADFDENKVDIISIPRDSYVEIPGRERREKINAAFTRGGGLKGQGFDKTIETVSHFLGGIPIHYYIGIDMNVVKDVVDIMGGVDYDVDLRVKIGERIVEKGFQHLNGQQVLDYSRTRNTGKGDIDRIDRQQKIVLAIFKELKSTKQLLKLPQYYTTVMERVHSNMDIKQIAGLALFAVNMEFENIQRHTIPGGFLNMDKISYWGIHERQKGKLIKEIFGVDIKIDPKNDIKYIKKELAEKEKAFKGAVAQGKEIVEKANRLIASHEKIIKDEETHRIKSYISQVDHAVESGDIDTIKKVTADFKEHTIKLQSTLSQRGDAIKNAETLLTETSGKIKKNQGFLEKEERDGLDKGMRDLKTAINSRDTKGINESAKALRDLSGRIFTDCQNRKEIKEIKDKEQKDKEQREKEQRDKEAKDKEAAERAKAMENANAIADKTKNKMEEYGNYMKDGEKAGLDKRLANLNKIIGDKNSDAKTINSASQDLKEYGDKVFSDCKQRKEDADKEDKNTKGDKEDKEDKEDKKTKENQENEKDTEKNM
ncbi:MAG TPA: LCP family protein [Clostridia bacterium]|nr:LCP family protein [Clostridia bacterium]